MIQPDVAHPDAETTRVKVPLADSRSERALGDSLDALVALTKDLAALIKNPKALAEDSKYAWYLVTTFHTPEKRFLQERAFFARCVKFPSLDRATLAYVRNVNSRARGIRGMDTELGHSDMRPAGAFAIVPLVLRDVRHVDALIEHMRGTDMDHETFHASLIEELLVRNGLCDETLRLLAFRAVDAAGQEGETNLKLAWENHGLRERLSDPKELRAFAELVDRVSQRKPGAVPRGYRELYVSNAGKALFCADPEKFRAWLDFFCGRGLKFDASECALGEPRSVQPPEKLARAWRDE